MTVRRALFVPAFDPLADPRVMAQLAVEAEQAGWDGLFVWDHLLYAEPVQRIADPWICLAAMAARTERLLMGPMVTPLPRRRPQVVAKQAVSLDQLCDGRLVLGFGLGDDGGARPGGGGELSAFGEVLDARGRAALLDSGLEVLTGLLSGEVVQHDRADGVRFIPTPVERPGGGSIPLWIGARWPNRPPLRRAARYDGVFAISLDSPSDVAALCQVLVTERGSLDGFDVVAELPAEADPAVWADAGATWLLTKLGPYRMDLEDCLRVARAGPAAR